MLMGRRNIIGAALSLAVLLMAVWLWEGKPDSGGDRIAVITVGGEPYQTIRLTDGKRQEIVVTTPYGTNRFVVEGGAVSCVEADCPERICCQRGAIRKVGEVIVCLPHKVLVEVKEAP